MIIYFFPETFDVKPVKQATLWANRINAVALLPGFGVDEINHRVFYRYLMPLNSRNIDMVKDVVDIAIKVIDIYSESFIRIAEGSTYLELLDEALTNYLSAIGASI